MTVASIYNDILEKIKNNKNSYYVCVFIYFMISICIIINSYFIYFKIKNDIVYTDNLLQILTFLLLINYIKIYTNVDTNIYYDYDKLFYKNIEGIEMSKEYCEKVEQLNSDIFKPMIKITDDGKNHNTNYLNEKYKKVYTLDEAVLTKKECSWIIYESEIYAKKNGWTTKRHISYPTVDNPVMNIGPISLFIKNIVYTKIMPFYEKYYNIDSRFLGVSDLFIVKYSVDKGMNELDYHEDGSVFSFIITLNDDFTGGGTRFININEDITSDVGKCVIFCGKNTHGGIKITSGTRYIIAGFLDIFSSGITGKMDK